MANETWNVRRVLEWTRGYLERKGDDKARLSAEWLLCDATGLTRMDLYLDMDRPLTPDELARMHAGIERRATGEPLQYVTGEMPFRHIVLRCERGVLIPRPETEVLVDAALEGVDAAEAAGVEYPRVLDLCTGTGCIALSIAKARPCTVAIATDLAPEAVRLARRNCRVLDLDGWVDVLQCDLASGVVPEFQGTFDVLVSNPPYIPSEVLARDVPSEVRDFEPALALDGGDDGLDVFRRILEVAPTMLKAGGMLCVELFEESLYDAAALAREQGGWEHVEVREDYTHRPRILVAVRE